MCGDDGKLREAGRHDVEMDGPGWVELDALTARLAGTDAAGSRVEEAGKLEFRGLLPEFEVSFIARVEILH